VVETKHAKTLDRYDLEFVDLFRGLEELLPGIVEEHLNADTATLFDSVESSIE
jgi:hypothetical protein